MLAARRRDLGDDLVADYLRRLARRGGKQVLGGLHAEF